ncbi:MAG: cysteine hydrolase [Rhizobiales bacterium]|nr:cysteine hydrolase [Hyphomicrobiales bacterium]
MTQHLLKTLADVADPSHSALIIIDPQHDFCSERGAMAQKFGFDMKQIREAVPRLNAMIEDCRKAGVLVVWVREIFADSKMHPNQKALWGAGDDIWLIREDGKGIDWYEGMIAPKTGEPVITKWQYDAFADTELDLMLKSRGIKSLLMTGFTTNVCVETTARHGYIKGYHIVLVKDCTGAPTQAEYESGVFNIQTYFGQAATSDELRQVWSKQAQKAA